VLRALILSVLLHLLVVSVWREGQARGWWRNLTMPRWMQLISSAMMPLTPKKLAAELPAQTQLTFVEVDPAQATPEPPKKPMFEGAKNTVAANREIKVPSEKPDIDGLQEKYLKTTEDAKPTPKPVAATPPPTPQQTPPPTPQPTPPPTPPQPQNTPHQNAPKESYTPGNLAMARPSDQQREGKKDSEEADQAQPQPPPAYQRPRTIAEALARSGNPGHLTRQRGGVSHIEPRSALDVKGTPAGDYMQRMTDAVQSRWYKLLEDQSADVTGKVTLHFLLHPDGRITDMKMVQNEVTDLEEATCERAVMDPAPYEKWSREMRLSLPSDSYDITFTFYYENY